jgi:hypothetical protein
MALGALLSAACGIRDKLPAGPVMSPWDRLREFGAPAPSGVTYTSDPAVAFPVLPVLAWGAAYDLDLVVVSRHPDWDMHEYARLSTPQGPVWLIKEARVGPLEQTLVADIPELDAWMPELPMARKSTPVQVEDRSTADRVDVTLSYENFEGEPVVMTYTGRPPEQAVPKRNGSTMGHSRPHVMAALDLPYRGLGGKVDLEIAGERIGVARIAGLVPFAMTLVQTQAGLAIGRFRQEPLGDEPLGCRTVHHAASGAEIDASWAVERGDGWVDLLQESEMRTLQYRFLERDGSLELASVTTWQWGRATPTSHLTLQPALPDLRRKFDGVATSRWVLDVNGQESHATGRLEARWEADGPRVALAPEEPWFVADRPMETAIRYEGGAAEVTIERTPWEGRTGHGAKNQSP